MHEKIRLGPNPKIIFHWIIIIALIFLLSFVSEDNPPAIAVIILLLFLSLLLNKTNYISIGSNIVEFDERFLLLLTKKKRTFKIHNIEKVIVQDKGASLTVTDLIIYEYLFFFFALLSGGFFYDRRYELIIIEKDKNQTKLKCNIPKSDIKRFGKVLTKRLSIKYEYIEK